MSGLLWWGSGHKTTKLREDACDKTAGLIPDIARIVISYEDHKEAPVLLPFVIVGVFALLALGVIRVGEEIHYTASTAFHCNNTHYLSVLKSTISEWNSGIDELRNEIDRLSEFTDRECPDKDRESEGRVCVTSRELLFDSRSVLIGARVSRQWDLIGVWLVDLPMTCKVIDSWRFSVHVLSDFYAHFFDGVYAGWAEFRSNVLPELCSLMLYPFTFVC